MSHSAKEPHCSALGQLAKRFSPGKLTFFQPGLGDAALPPHWARAQNEEGLELL